MNYNTEHLPIYGPKHDLEHDTIHNLKHGPFANDDYLDNMLKNHNNESPNVNRYNVSNKAIYDNRFHLEGNEINQQLIEIYLIMYLLVLLYIKLVLDIGIIFIIVFVGGGFLIVNLFNSRTSVSSSRISMRDRIISRDRRRSPC